MEPDLPPPTLPCRIILCEDDPRVRARFARLIEGWGGGTLLASCGTLASCLEAISTQEADLLITDLNLPDGNGLSAIEMMRRLRPKAEAMVISVLADDNTVLTAIEAGAAGYLLKDADERDLIEAIADLMAGRSPISSRIARVLIRRLAAQQTPVPALDQGPVVEEADPPQIGEAPHLTPREMDILWGISKGFTYAELAEQLKLSKQTVPVHIRNIYKKLQVNNRSEAVYEAARQGLIQIQ